MRSRSTTRTRASSSIATSSPTTCSCARRAKGDIVKLLDFGSVKDKSDPSKKLTVLGTTIGSPFYMAPEQAQGLETLDHRADVWALAAITYECVAGQVPFKGNNGPSILLEILTKEPQPVSVTGQGQKFPIPPTLDRVLAHGFKKAPGMRISSVGALADAVGQAYGLQGTHLEWAVMPQQELAARIAAKLPQLMQALRPAKPADSAADGFFGESDALGPNAAARAVAFRPERRRGWLPRRRRFHPSRIPLRARAGRRRGKIGRILPTAFRGAQKQSGLARGGGCGRRSHWSLASSSCSS